MRALTHAFEVSRPMHTVAAEEPTQRVHLYTHCRLAFRRDYSAADTFVCAGSIPKGSIRRRW